MNIVAINGSPRREGNTATLCRRFLEGAEAAGKDVNTRLVHLYDLDYTGCRSCFACKRADDRTYGHCGVKDGLHPLLQELAGADGMVLGSPIYFGDITGAMRCFLERLLFPHQTYEPDYRTIAPRRLQTAVIYTMNVTEERMRQFGYDKHLAHMESVIGRIHTSVRRLYAFNTCQFKDYSRYRAGSFSEQEKLAWRDTHFPEDCCKAFLAGQEMAAGIAHAAELSYLCRNIKPNEP